MKIIEQKHENHGIKHESHGNLEEVFRLLFFGRLSQERSFMRKRNKSFVVRCTEKELEELDEKVARSGLNRETYVRKILAGAEIKETPGLDYFEFKEIYLV